MIKISVRGDIKGAIEKLNLAQRQVPYATARALTKTAQRVQQELKQEIGRVFDRPTSFTRDALYVKNATKQNLTATVKIKDHAVKGNPAVKYLFAEVQGGARDAKGFERLLQRNGVMPSGWFAIPTSYIKLDAFGNVPGSMITKLLSQLGASRDPTANETGKARKLRNRRKTTGRYFAVQPGRSHLRPGIYERASFAAGSAVRPIFIFTSMRPTYKQRFRFYEIGSVLARKFFPDEFRAAAIEAMGTAR